MTMAFMKRSRCGLSHGCEAHRSQVGPHALWAVHRRHVRAFVPRKAAGYGASSLACTTLEPSAWRPKCRLGTLAAWSVVCRTVSPLQSCTWTTCAKTGRVTRTGRVSAPPGLCGREGHCCIIRLALRGRRCVVLCQNGASADGTAQRGVIWGVQKFASSVNASGLWSDSVSGHAHVDNVFCGPRFNSTQAQRDLAVQKGQICLDQAITKTLIHIFVDEACGFSTSSH